MQLFIGRLACVPHVVIELCEHVVNEWTPEHVSSSGKERDSLLDLGDLG